MPTGNAYENEFLLSNDVIGPNLAHRQIPTRKIKVLPALPATKLTFSPLFDCFQYALDSDTATNSSGFNIWPINFDFPGLLVNIPAEGSVRFKNSRLLHSTLNW